MNIVKVEEDWVAASDADETRDTVWVRGTLPMDIIMEILARLPVKAIGRCRGVCKSWYSLTVDPLFVRKQLTINHHREAITDNLSCDMIHYDTCTRGFYIWRMNSVNGGLSSTTDPPKKLNFPAADLLTSTRSSKVRFGELIGSCNGLLCCMWSTGKQVVLLVWNPSIDKYKIIPLPQSRMPEQMMKEGWHIRDRFGFRFVPQTGDYKIIMLQTNQKGWPDVETYSLTTGTWKRRSSWDDGENQKNSSYILYPKRYENHNIKGNVHWIAQKRTCSTAGAERVIMAFDMMKDKLREIPFPSAASRSPLRTWYQNVADYHDTCALILQYGKVTDIWVMKDYNTAGSWTKLYGLCHKLDIPRDITKNGSPIIHDVANNGQVIIKTQEQSTIVYDPTTGNSRTFDLTMGVCPMVVYVESIALLDKEEETRSGKV